MEKIIFIIFIFIVNITFVSSQHVMYQVCDSCRTSSNNDATNHLFNYGIPTAFEPKDVEGDFDMRWYTGVGNIWHRGIDYSSLDVGRGDVDRGDALLAIEGGTVTQIDGTGYKYIVIEGDNAHHFGYGHIFQDQNPGSSHLISGNFILKRYSRNNVYLYAIINLENCSAIASTSGDTLIYTNSICQDTFVTTNTVIHNQAIAPMGGSGGYPVHLHLYRFRDPNLAGNSVQNVTNCMDPWTFIEHPTLPNLNGYELEMHTHNEPNNTVIINYPSTTPQTIRAQAKMNSSTAPSYNSGNNQTTDNSRYENTIMAVNEINVLLRKLNNGTFSPFEGAEYNSKLNLGGVDSITNHFYPSSNLITTTFGNWNNTTGMGVGPTQYNLGEHWAY